MHSKHVDESRFKFELQIDLRNGAFDYFLSINRMYFSEQKLTGEDESIRFNKYGRLTVTKR